MTLDLGLERRESAAPARLPEIAPIREPLLIAKAGVPVNVLQQGSYGLNSQSNSYFVTSKFYDDPANRDALVRFLRAEA